MYACLLCLHVWICDSKKKKNVYTTQFETNKVILTYYSYHHSHPWCTTHGIIIHQLLRLFHLIPIQSRT